MRILVGAAPGTAMDVVARQIGDALSKNGTAVIVDNRPSAGGILALQALREAPPDGQTLSLVHAMQMGAAPSLFPKLPYDPAVDFAPVGILLRGPQVLVVNPAVPASNWLELSALLKAQPGRYRYSTPGNGSPQHLTMEQIKAAIGVDVGHIPYRGPAATTAVLGGEVELMIEGIGSVLPHIRAGTLRAIAVGGPQRVPLLAEVPTFSELGVAGIGTVWIGMVAPKATPPAVVQGLNDALSRVVQSTTLRNAFESVARIVSPGSPAEMAATIRAETIVWREVVQRAHIAPD